MNGRYLCLKQLMAEKVGITANRLYYYEKDKRQPDVELIKTISVALGISGDDLLGTKWANEKAPAPEGTEDEKQVQMVMQGLTRLLVEAGWIAPGADLSDAQLRTLASYVIGLNAYFNSDV